MAFERREEHEGHGEPVAGQVELRPDRHRSGVVAHGTLACPSCDAPVSPGGPVSITAPLSCPFCATSGPVRDFLSLAAPTRAARVVVRLRF